MCPNWRFDSAGSRLASDGNGRPSPDETRSRGGKNYVVFSGRKRKERENRVIVRVNSSHMIRRSETTQQTRGKLKKEMLFLTKKTFRVF